MQHRGRDLRPVFSPVLVAHVGILYWISYVVVQYGYLPVYVGIVAMLLLAAYLSLYTACFAMGRRLPEGKRAFGYSVGAPVVDHP